MIFCVVLFCLFFKLSKTSTITPSVSLAIITYYTGEEKKKKRKFSSRMYLWNCPDIKKTWKKNVYLVSIFRAKDPSDTELYKFILIQNAIVFLQTGLLSFVVSFSLHCITFSSYRLDILVFFWYTMTEVSLLFLRTKLIFFYPGGTLLS